MKKQLILMLALAFSVITFAQKKELKAAEKAIKTESFAEAKATLNSLESMVASMDEKSKAKYYLLKGKALYANGKGTEEEIEQSIQSLNKAESSYAVEVGNLKQEMIASILTNANNNYKSNNFIKASKGFNKLYKLIPSDTSYLYYAASSAINGKDFDAALESYLQLKELGYTGIETQYLATNVETGEEELFDKPTRDLMVKAKTHIKPVDRKSESKSAEITKQIAFLYLNKGDDAAALQAIKEARKNEPKNINLLLSEANLYQKTGDIDAYKTLIEEAVTIDPDNVDLIFNLGVISSNNNDLEKAKEYYQKVIDKDPTYVNAQTNMAALILDEEQNLNKQMNALGTSAADNKRYDELKAAKKNVYLKAIPYLEAVLKVEPNNIDVAKTLMSIFSAVGNNEKYNAIKTVVDSLSQGN